jgi:membrane protease YdiL (CAAX protease family)
MCRTRLSRDAEGMTNTQSLSAQLDAPASSKQYSLTKILAVWASVTVPMGLLAWVVAPAIIPHTSLHPGLVHWMLMVVGMMWQFVVSLAVLRHELGGLHWPALKKRIWLNIPRDPRSGKPRKVLFLWALPAVAAVGIGAYLGSWLDTAWTDWLPFLHEPSYTNAQSLADPKLQGQWWILGLALTSMLFNYVLGEELLFRGVLLPRMAGVFGRWDWVANSVLFGLYHVHKIWAWPSMITTAFGLSWAARRYRSFWMGVIVHGVEGFFIVVIVAVLAGWYP